MRVRLAGSRPPLFVRWIVPVTIRADLTHIESQGLATRTHGGATLVRIEDGFLRSVGLGANLVQPLSWVIDDIGIYYE